MPIRDGTGPLGLGPGSGRGRGMCSGRSGYRISSQPNFRGKQGWLLGMAVPLVVAVIRDIMNPSGLLRQIVHAGSRGRIANKPQQIWRDTESSMLIKENVPIHKKRMNS